MAIERSDPRGPRYSLGETTVSLNWNSVAAEHVAKACDLVAAGQSRPRAGAKGLFVTYKGRQLPAKHVLRVAYQLANKLPLESVVKFSSGEGTIQRLRKLGYEVDRTPAPIGEN